MIRSFLTGLVFTIALASCSGSGPTLAGEWAPQSAEVGGQPLPVSNFGGANLHLTADTYEFAGDKGTYTVLSTGSPAQMDIMGQGGPNNGRTIKAIFELAGDHLTVCYQLGPGDRPNEFKTAEGTQVLLIHYERVQQGG
jgi:uncharacterized protein (TIGR03067 family)